jgi:GntR family transcriptional regulator of vanillate catabolism
MRTTVYNFRAQISRRVSVTDENLSQLDRALLGLRSLALSGEYSGKERLSEVAVAKRLGISRTPLRQAMDRLVAEGLLERIKTGGCRVATFSTEDIADAIELRGVMEGTAARLAAERGVDPDLMAQASDALDQIDAAWSAHNGFNFDAYVTKNARFHRLLGQFPNSPILEKEIDRISLLPLASPSAFLSDQALVPDFQDSLRFAQRQHRFILDAIMRGEGTRAEALTREHARLALINFDYLKASRRQHAKDLPGLALVAND